MSSPLSLSDWTFLNHINLLLLCAAGLEPIAPVGHDSRRDIHIQIYLIIYPVRRCPWLQLPLTYKVLVRLQLCWTFIGSVFFGIEEASSSLCNWRSLTSHTGQGAIKKSWFNKPSYISVFCFSFHVWARSVSRQGLNTIPLPNAIV